MFCTQTLQKKTTAYPSVGQKKLNGASSRMMIYFAATISAGIQREHPCDLHRHWFFKTFFENGLQKQPMKKSPLTFCWYIFWHSYIPERWICDVFQSFSDMTVVFAQNGPGQLPQNEVDKVEHCYLKYRENYNSVSLCFGDFLFWLDAAVSIFFW